MTYDPEIHNRRTIRMAGYDYASAGWYFVTLCVHNHRPILSTVIVDSLALTDFGRIVQHSWLWLNNQYAYVDLDSYVIIPNHVHGIIVINESTNAQSCRGGSRTALHSATGQSKKRKPLGRLIGVFKTRSTKLINEKSNTPGMRFWQRNYYEHIIRNENELAHIREYIRLNPAKWLEDRYFLD